MVYMHVTVKNASNSSPNNISALNYVFSDSDGQYTFFN